MRQFLVGPVLGAVFGVLLIIGAFQRWRWLVDPPVEAWPFYSQSFIKKVFGTKAVTAFTYFAGAAILLLSLIGLLFPVSRFLTRRY